MASSYPPAEVPVMIPKTDEDVEMLVTATIEFMNYHGSPIPEYQIRKQVEECRHFKMDYLRPFTFKEMKNRW